MKKNVLALSMTAAILSLGLSTGASAMTGGAAAAGATATSLVLNGDGVGHMLIVPYYTAQAENSTLINLVNTDLTNGKAVKVRFRGAANSDDVLDFQVFMSPGDVWTANISKGPLGNAVLTTKDTTCLRPDRAAVGSTTTFPTSTARLDPSLTGDALMNGTREGYIEILNMADIPPKAAWQNGEVTTAAGSGAANTTAGVSGALSTANPLFTAIKHVAKVAPCGTVLQALDNVDPAFESAAVNAASTGATGSRTLGLLPPTSGLMANWTIINVVGAAAWSGNAVAVEGRVGGVAGTGSVSYFPQTGTATGNAVAGTIDNFTADPILHNQGYRLDSNPAVAIASKVLGANQNDLPDLSTPYILQAAVNTATTGPKSQALLLTAALAAKSATNEFLTDSTISASTDWVFSMPTRRYSVALAYSKIGVAAGAGVTDTGVRYSNLVVDANAANGGTTLNDAAYVAKATGLDTGYFSRFNASTVVTTANGGRQVCVSGIGQSATDREESASVATATLSPATAGSPLLFCGEDSVLSLNLGSVAAPTRSLKATVTQRDIDWGTAGYVDGWMTLTTPGNTATVGGNFGLPTLGGAFMKAAAGTATFGTFYNHRFTR